MARLRLLHSIAIALLLAPGIARAELSDVTGEWATKGMQSIIDVHPCAANRDTLCGTIVWLWDPVDKDGEPYRDDKNADPNLRTRTIRGMEIMSDFKPKGDGATWIDGGIYNPEDGRTYGASFRLRAPGVVELEGCALGLFCGSQIWRRPHEVIDRALKR